MIITCSNLVNGKFIFIQVDDRYGDSDESYGPQPGKNYDPGTEYFNILEVMGQKLIFPWVNRRPKNPKLSKPVQKEHGEDVKKPSNQSNQWVNGFTTKHRPGYKYF